MGRVGRSGGSGNCAWFVLYKRILNFKKSDKNFHSPIRNYQLDLLAS